MRNKQVKKWLIISSVVAAILVSLFCYYYRTQTVWVESEPYQRVSKDPAKTLVVVYSRTGNTLGVAKEVANYFDGDLLRIYAPQYSRDWKGGSLAARHADEKVSSTPIKHDPVDLSRYDLIFLCSPTWWFRPAVPLWSFVENHQFEGKQVFLIMTGNSRFKRELTGKFGELVEKKNGRFMDLLFIRRGRIYWQKNPEEVNTEVIEALKARRKIWPVKVN